VWLTSKNTDPLFSLFLTISFFLFTLEILVTSVVNDDYKYSFFFNLDIIATLSLISDIPWMLQLVGKLVGNGSPSDSVNVIPGIITSENVMSNKLQQVFKSLRLIRLIRIIKLYKYILQSMSKNEENEEEIIMAQTEEDEANQSLFQRETDPSKLGKALSDQNTREVIIGVLLMLMVLPLLSPSEIDYSKAYGLRGLFNMGTSVCQTTSAEPLLIPPENVDTRLFITAEKSNFFCDN